MGETWKATNPKDAIGSDKVPLHLFPLTAIIYGCLAMLEGLLKYGRSNFRAIGVRSSIYYDAARRHLDAWFEGEDTDPDSGLPHLGKALACIAILIDAKAAGKLNDDRMVVGGFSETLKELTPHVKRLKDQHADKTPKHYTITDNREVLVGKVKRLMKDGLERLGGQLAEEERRVFDEATQPAVKVEGSMCDANGNYVGFTPENKMGPGYRPLRED